MPTFTPSDPKVEKELDGVRLEQDVSTAEWETDQFSLANDPSIIRKSGRVPFPAWFIIATELCERFAFYGASLLFQQYMLQHLGLPKNTSTAINRCFTFFAYLTSMIGAFIADTYWGKYRTIVIFAIVYMLGLILLAASASTASVAAGFGLAGFCLALFLFIAPGTGGIKSNVSAFAAEQVEPGIKPTKVVGVYTDSRMTVESVFRYFYWAINVGSFVGQLVCPIVAKTNYAYAFMIPAIVFFFGIVAIILGRKKYVTKNPNGTVLRKVIRCIRYARKNKSKLAPGAYWLDAAKGQGPDGEWDDLFVDGLGRSIQACKVFLFYPFYWALYGNMQDNFINQGVNLKRPSWLGPEQLNLVNSIVLIICIPLFDRFFFPVMRRFGFKLGPIVRITIGFTICTLGFVYVTVLQNALYNTGPYYNFQDLTGLPKGEDPVNDISVWLQVPPYIFIAISEIFASATGLEYAFKQAPSEMKSLVLALFLFTNCGGSLIGLILSIWSKDPNFVYVFGIQTGILGVMTIIFYFVFRKFDNQTESVVQ
ncbi:MAG: POT family-domain-containing protein [Piptocephalis tieghemiana]|nr:MAG: POT family-domain-containing protein [Piptocephalis tieghemiana]